MPRRLPRWLAVALWASWPPGEAAPQQVADTTFRFANASPAFAPGAGPEVCVDAGHQNFHTLDGRYATFGRLLSDDGFRPRSVATFSAEALRGCRVLATANARGDAGASAYPHGSAFRAEEISAVLEWVREGGSLLLITDHPPNVGSVTPLLALLGFQPLEGYAGPSPEAPTGLAIFGAIDERGLAEFTARYDIPHERYRASVGEPGRLGEHAVLRGRSPSERIASVASFTGTAFYPAAEVTPLLVFGPAATGVSVIALNLPDAEEGEFARFPLEGWIQAGVREFGRGRVAVLGEAAMCSAQWAGAQRVTMGMNAPFASQNAQFCLNVVRWLSAVLD